LKGEILKYQKLGQKWNADEFHFIMFSFFIYKGLISLYISSFWNFTSKGNNQWCWLIVGTKVVVTYM
jgi:hypothetical protein